MDVVPDWALDLTPVGPVQVVRHPGCPIPLRSVDIALEPWPHAEEPSLRANCRKRSSLTIGPIGRSCPEIDVVVRLRACGWAALWMKSFRCGPDAWRELRGDVDELPPFVQARLAAVRDRRGMPAARSPKSLAGVPDVVAWRDDPRRIVFVECKRPGESLARQAGWLVAALGPDGTGDLVEPNDVLVSVSLIASRAVGRGAPGMLERQDANAERGSDRDASGKRPRGEWTEESSVALKVSETYRGHTIFYDKDTRRWLVAVAPDDPLVPHASAFQARRSVNIALDGHSESWPKRER